MDWYPDKRQGLLWGAGLLIALVAVGALLARSIVGVPPDLGLFLRALVLVALLVLLALLAYGYYGLANLTYRVERNGILIRWGAVVDAVPVGEIVEIVPFAKPARPLTPGPGWPGYRIGRMQAEGVGPLRLYITRPPEQCLLVRTRARSYLVSPANAEGFLADYRTRRKLGYIAKWPQELRLPWLFRLSIWRDRLAAGLALPGLALNVGLFGYLVARYPGLPLRLVLSYNLLGLSDRVGARSELFLLPVVGLAVVLLNAGLAALLHRRERVLALLLLCNGPVVQALIWLAAVRLAR